MDIFSKHLAAVANQIDRGSETLIVGSVLRFHAFRDVCDSALSSIHPAFYNNCRYKRGLLDRQRYLVVCAIFLWLSCDTECLPLLAESQMYDSHRIKIMFVDAFGIPRSNPPKSWNVSRWFQAQSKQKSVLPWTFMKSLLVINTSGVMLVT